MFEKTIKLKPSKMSVCHGFTTMLNEFVTMADYQLKAIIETDDIETMQKATETVCGLIKDYLIKINDTYMADDQMHVHSDILRYFLNYFLQKYLFKKKWDNVDRQKLAMLLDTIGEERNEALKGDELMNDLNEISESQQRSTISATKSPIAAKTAKDLLNSKEKRSSRTTIQNIPDREAIQCRANSLKRAMHNVMEHSKLLDNKQKRFGGTQDNLCVFTSSSSDTTPWSSPVPPMNTISPSVSTTQLTCISPLPDLRRDSMDDYFFSSVDLPVPMQFADGSSRRGSANVPHSISEANEVMAELFPLCKDPSQKVSASQNHLKHSTPSSSSVVNVVPGHQRNSQMCHLDYLDSCCSPHDNPNDDRGLMPVEAFERMQLMRKRTTHPALYSDTNSKNASLCATTNMLQVPSISLPPMEIQRPPTPVKETERNEELPQIEIDLHVSNHNIIKLFLASCHLHPIERMEYVLFRNQLALTISRARQVTFCQP